MKTRITHCSSQEARRGIAERTDKMATSSSGWKVNWKNKSVPGSLHDSSNERVNTTHQAGAMTATVSPAGSPVGRKRLPSLFPPGTYRHGTKLLWRIWNAGRVRTIAAATIFFMLIGPFFPFALTFVSRPPADLAAALLLYPFAFVFGWPVAGLTGLVFGILFSATVARFSSYAGVKGFLVWTISGTLIGVFCGLIWCLVGALSNAISIADLNSILSKAEFSPIRKFFHSLVAPQNFFLYIGPSVLCGVLFAIREYFWRAETPTSNSDKVIAP